MKGIGLIVIVIAMVIIAILTVKNIKRGAAARAAENPELQMPQDIRQLPSQVKERLDQAGKDAAERTKKAMEGVE